MDHLTPELWKRFRSGQLTVEERRQGVAHLEQSCEVCEAVLAALPAQDDLDAPVDAALARARPPSSVSDEERLQRLEVQVLNSLAPRRRRLARLLPPAVGFAAGCAAMAAVFLLPVAPVQRLKGDPGAANGAALTALVSEPRSGGPPLLTRLEPSRSYGPATELYLTYELPTPAYVYLVRVGADGGAELTYPPGGEAAQEAAGLHPLTIGGVVQAYSLSGLSGRQRFVLLTSTGNRLSAEVVLHQAVAAPKSQGASFEVNVSQEP